jgi:hypothetical protein
MYDCEEDRLRDANDSLGRALDAEREELARLRSENEHLQKQITDYEIEAGSRIEEARELFSAAGGVDGMSPHHDPNWYLRRAAQMFRSRNEKLKAALVSLGHVILGCDGHPCRVEAQADAYVEDMLNHVETMSRAHSVAMDAAAERDKLLTREAKWRELCESMAERIRDHIDELEDCSYMHDEEHVWWTMGTNLLKRLEALKREADGDGECREA